jgi:hypothetical protein
MQVASHRRLGFPLAGILAFSIFTACSDSQPTGLNAPESGALLSGAGIGEPHPLNAAALTPAAGTMSHSPSGAIIDNGVIQLGVLNEGHLGMPGGSSSSGLSSTTFVGLRYMPTNSDATAPGCICEGWGVADAVTNAFGQANVAVGGIQNLVLESFTHTASEATSVVRVRYLGADRFRVTHRYQPSTATSALYEVTVTIENISGLEVSDLRYRRVMDWDIAPNTFSEFVTIQGTVGATNVLYASNNGFAQGNPLGSRTSNQPLPVQTGDFVDQGPADHGALFDFGFGALANGESRTFITFYGAAGNQADALAALGVVGAEVYSFGQANYSGAPWTPTPGLGAPTGTHGHTSGEPHTFIFAFKGVGGGPIVPPPNTAPVLDPIGNKSVNEGSLLTFTATASDADGDPLTFSLDGAPSGASIDPITGVFSWTPADGPATHTFRVVVSDGTLSAEEEITVTVANVAPSVGTITGLPIAPVPVNTTVSLSVGFTDPGVLDTHTAVINWGNGSTTGGNVAQGAGSGTVTGSHTYTVAGIYRVTVTVTDNDGDSGSSSYEFVVVYDPGGGFVTGGGWINVPAGSYTPDPSAAGPARFGFVSKYLPGRTQPDGNTQFQFHAGGMNFHSVAYDWLVVAGARAQYRGTGRINGTGGYCFLLTAIDGQVSGGGGVDRLRLKVWNCAGGEIVFDNKIGEPDDATPTAITSGSIVIHR